MPAPRPYRRGGAGGLFAFAVLVYPTRMDFSWTADEAAFRQRLRDFLAATLPDDWERFSQHGPASPALTEFAKTFCGKLADDGLLTPHWPKEIGGEGLDPWHQTILAEEMWIV